MGRLSPEVGGGDKSPRSDWLSFVIPVREEGAYIGRTLEHLNAERARHGLEFQTIVVDGGVTGGCVVGGCVVGG